jgi:hypothetical protein
VHEAEADFVRNQDDNPAPDFEGWGRLMDEEKELFVLVQGSVRHLATAVYRSKALKRGFDLSAFVADDTIHVTEGLYSPIKCQPGQVFKVSMAWDPKSLMRCDFYLGNPGLMHVDSYKSVTKLDFHAGTVRIPLNIEKRDMVLFAIVKPKLEDFRKFVFVVRAN